MDKNRNFIAYGLLIVMSLVLLVAGGYEYAKYKEKENNRKLVMSALNSVPFKRFQQLEKEYLYLVDEIENSSYYEKSENIEKLNRFLGKRYYNSHIFYVDEFEKRGKIEIERDYEILRRKANIW